MDGIKISKIKQISKGEILLSPGKVSKYTYRVSKGCLRSYVIDASGKEHIIQFAPEDWLIGDMDSSTNNKPTNIYIDAIEDSEVELIATSEFEDLSSLDIEILRIMTYKMRNNLIATNKRIISLLSATANDRYIEFTNTYPTLVQRLPLKLIASYIGITPEYLSDLRGKLSKKSKK